MGAVLNVAGGPLYSFDKFTTLDGVSACIYEDSSFPCTTTSSTGAFTLSDVSFEHVALELSGYIKVLAAMGIYQTDSKIDGWLIPTTSEWSAQKTKVGVSETSGTGGITFCDLGGSPSGTTVALGKTSGDGPFYFDTTGSLDKTLTSMGKGVWNLFNVAPETYDLTVTPKSSAHPGGRRARGAHGLPDGKARGPRSTVVEAEGLAPSKQEAQRDRPRGHGAGGHGSAGEERRREGARRRPRREERRRDGAHEGDDEEDARHRSGEVGRVEPREAPAPPLEEEHAYRGPEPEEGGRGPEDRPAPGRGPGTGWGALRRPQTRVGRTRSARARPRARRATGVPPGAARSGASPGAAVQPPPEPAGLESSSGGHQPQLGDSRSSTDGSAHPVWSVAVPVVKAASVEVTPGRPLTVILALAGKRSFGVST
jgi:hypothetical protein